MWEDLKERLVVQNVTQWKSIVESIVLNCNRNCNCNDEKIPFSATVTMQQLQFVICLSNGNEILLQLFWLSNSNDVPLLFTFFAVSVTATMYSTFTCFLMPQ
jgi:hypothetical protein